MREPGRPFDDTARQPVFTAPLVAVLLAVSMPLLFLAQQQVGDPWLQLAFRPSSLFDGGWWPGVVTAVFVHGGWGHVAMNAVAALAFGPPVARMFPGARGAAIFLLFYMACGIASSVGYALVHPHSGDALVGASGAVFGLMGAAMRLLGRRDGTLTPLTDRRLLLITGVLMAVNAGAGLIGLAPGANGATIAWEAHAFGYVVGLLAIGPLVRIAGRRADSFDSPADLRDPPV